MSDEPVEGERAITRVEPGRANAGGAPPVNPSANPPANRPANPPVNPPVSPQQPAPPASPPSGPAEATTWHKGFAIGSALVVLLLIAGFVYVSQLLAGNLGLDAAQAAKLDGRALLASRVIGPVTVIGVVVTLVGVWMAMTEWRGRFAEQKKAAEPSGDRDVSVVPKIIEALGALRGAALVLVSGIAILLGVAWMTSATASAPPAPAPTSTASTTTT